MLQFGINITQPGDELRKISLERIYRGIVDPKDKLRRQVERLRLVRAMDPKQYARLKKQLPYFVCGNFHPPYRRREHFSTIRYFVIDLDHFEQAQLSRREVARQLQEDDRLFLLFTSPGGDGLKLVFQLSEPCFDPGLYALFYKAFLQILAQQYQLEKVIDTRTHDTTRACFFSVDPDAYFNPQAKPVALTQYFDAGRPDAQREVAKAHKSLKEQSVAGEQPEKEPLSDEVLLQIKKKLNPNFRPRKKREAYVPPELESVMPRVEKALEEMGVGLAKVEPIQYGKKLTVAAGKHWAEVNVFFGKRGFSIVKTTKSGSHAELAGIVYQILYELLSGENH